MTVNLWPDVDHALAYLRKADAIPHRTEGEAELIAQLPDEVGSVVDLGCGDGRLLALVLTARPNARGVAADFSPAMLERAEARFAGDERVTVVAHDLDSPIDALAAPGSVDAVVSSFAIHHVVDERKRAVCREAFALLRPGGVFANLEHVASSDDELHRRFLERIGTDPADDDPSNKLTSVDTQLTWLTDIGYVHVECAWKWLELALLVGRRPAAANQ